MPTRCNASFVATRRAPAMSAVCAAQRQRDLVSRARYHSLAPCLVFVWRESTLYILVLLLDRSTLPHTRQEQ